MGSRLLSVSYKFIEKFTDKKGTLTKTVENHVDLTLDKTIEVPEFCNQRGPSSMEPELIRKRAKTIKNESKNDADRANIVRNIKAKDKALATATHYKSKKEQEVEACKRQLFSLQAEWDEATRKQSLAEGDLTNENEKLVHVDEKAVGLQEEKVRIENALEMLKVMVKHKKTKEGKKLLPCHLLDSDDMQVAMRPLVSDLQSLYFMKDHRVLGILQFMDLNGCQALENVSLRTIRPQRAKALLISILFPAKVPAHLQQQQSFDPELQEQLFAEDIFKLCEEEENFVEKERRHKRKSYSDGLRRGPLGSPLESPLGSPSRPTKRTKRLNNNPETMTSLAKEQFDPDILQQFQVLQEQQRMRKQEQSQSGRQFPAIEPPSDLVNEEDTDLVEHPEPEEPTHLEPGGENEDPSIHEDVDDGDNDNDNDDDDNDDNDNDSHKRSRNRKKKRKKKRKNSSGRGGGRSSSSSSSSSSSEEEED